MLNLSKIFHQNLGIAAFAEFCNAFFSDLSHALMGQSQLVADFLKTFFMAANAEAFADDGDFAFLEHLA